jgi:hypothetical protein
MIHRYCSTANLKLDRFAFVINYKWKAELLPSSDRKELAIVHEYCTRHDPLVKFANFFVRILQR